MESVLATREEAQDFLSIQNYNYNFGYGSCYGDSFGYSDGFGHSDGCGYGSISGDGYGYGYDIGSGCSRSQCFGYGFGDGEGSGDGNGHGDSYGYSEGYVYDSVDGGIKSLNGNTVNYIDGVPTIITQVHGDITCGYIVKNDLTLEACFIAKVGYSFAHGKTIKEAVADAEAKEAERLPIEQRIEKFREVFGSLDSEHVGKEFYDWHHILTGSCRMGRDEFCKSHGIDLTKMYSVRYFLDITKGSYGSDVIRLIREAYKDMAE